jgi:hypothetical protein
MAQRGILDVALLFPVHLGIGPGSVIYHEGLKYIMSRLLIAEEKDDELASGWIKQCAPCGYIHPVGESDARRDACVKCAVKESQRH